MGSIQNGSNLLAACAVGVDQRCKI